MNVIVRPIPVSEARPLRKAILRPSLALETCIYPGDDSPDSFHAGAYAGKKLVGVASVIRQALSFLPLENAWRLRGMAVAEDARRQGCGRLLIQACVDFVADHGGRLLWCNARSVVLPFYCSLGFTPFGDEFMIPESGPHFVMVRKL